jgi:dTMP kinase
MYIVFEGIVGTGKSTQSKLLLDYLKSISKNKEVILTREPGGTEISEQIRKLVQGSKYSEKMDYACESYLYAASRAQSLRAIVRPILEKGGTIISDRSFISSLAYQGFARKLGLQKVLDINKVAIDGFIPDIIFYLKLDIESGLKRTFDKDGDKFESKDIDFFKEIEKGYAEISKLKMFEGKWFNIEAFGTKNEVFERIKKILHTFY